MWHLTCFSITSPVLRGVEVAVEEALGVLCLQLRGGQRSPQRNPRRVKVAVPGHHSQETRLSVTLEGLPDHSLYASRVASLFTVVEKMSAWPQCPWKSPPRHTKSTLAWFPDHSFLLQEHLLEKLLGNWRARGAEIICCYPLTHRKEAEASKNEVAWVVRCWRKMIELEAAK